MKVEATLNLRRTGRRKAAKPPAPPPAPKVPRIAKLMALAIKMQDMVDRGEVENYAELARLAGVSRARITQIMNLNLLSPSLQEWLLFLESSPGRDAVTLKGLQAVCLMVDCRRQASKLDFEKLF